MILTAEYAKQWGVSLKQDDAEVTFLVLDLALGLALVETTDEDGVITETEHPLSDFTVEGLDRFVMIHGG